MTRIQKKGLQILPALLIILLFFGLLFNTKGCLLAAQSGIILCIETVIPALFPFFVLSNLVIGMNLSENSGKFEFSRKLFGIDRELFSAYLLGIIGGYPVGAKSVAALYRDGRCSKSNAERVLGFCNNSGPAFILGVVGIYIFESMEIGVILYVIHILASFTIGIATRSNVKFDSSPQRIPPRKAFAEVFVTSVRDSIAGVINVSAFVIFFSVFIYIWKSFGLFSIILIPIEYILSALHLSCDFLSPLLIGIFEVTCGVKMLSDVNNTLAALVTASFLLGFGGICVHFQVISLFDGTDLSPVLYIKGKIMHGLLASLYTFLLMPLFSFVLADRAYFNVLFSTFVMPSAAILFFSAVSCVILLICGIFILRKYKKKHL